MRGFAISLFTWRRVASLNALFLFLGGITLSSCHAPKDKNGQFRPDEEILEAHSYGNDGGLAREIRSKTAAPLFLQKDVEEGVVNPNLAVIFDEAQFSEPIHKKTHSGSGCANHLSQ